VFQGIGSSMSRRRALAKLLPPDDQHDVSYLLLHDVSYLMLHDVSYLFYWMLKSSDSRDKMFSWCDGRGQCMR
jgi:hypothetical protein